MRSAPSGTAVCTERVLLQWQPDLSGRYHWGIHKRAAIAIKSNVVFARCWGFVGCRAREKRQYQSSNARYRSIFRTGILPKVKRENKGKGDLRERKSYIIFCDSVVRTNKNCSICIGTKTAVLSTAGPGSWCRGSTGWLASIYPSHGAREWPVIPASMVERHPELHLIWSWPHFSAI